MEIERDAREEPPEENEERPDAGMLDREDIDREGVLIRETEGVDIRPAEE